MKPSCPRSFEAEAWRDGRLGDAEAARFRAHASACSICTRELQSLQALGDALRAPLDRAYDELHVRRERTRLLAAFDAELASASRRGAVKWRHGAAVAAAFVFALIVVLRHLSAPQHATVAASRAPTLEPIAIRADSAARWSRRMQDGSETIRLESGALSIRVDHAARRDRTAAAPRLRVILPDGELEDIGTIFSVSADAGRTTRVSVQEGSVVLRLKDEPPLALGAGDSWSPPPSASPSVPMTPPSPAAPSKSPASSALPVASPAATSPTKASAPDRGAAAEFRAAMAAFDGGDDARAAALFRAFIVAHPLDSRAEDAAYLRILALQRSTSAASMREAAAEYLRRYPHGFRKTEVEALTR